MFRTLFAKDQQYELVFYVKLENISVFYDLFFHSNTKILIFKFYLNQFYFNFLHLLKKSILPSRTTKPECLKLPFLRKVWQNLCVKYSFFEVGQISHIPVSVLLVPTFLSEVTLSVCRTSKKIINNTNFK